MKISEEICLKNHIYILRGMDVGLAVKNRLGLSTQGVEKLACTVV